MKVAVPKEIRTGERRVAIIPDSVKRMIKKGIEVTVESGAGEESMYSDADYEAAGAKIESSVEALFGNADVVLKVNQPGSNPEVGKNEIDMMREGSALIATLLPLINHDLVKKLAEKKITCILFGYYPKNNTCPEHGCS